MQAKLNWSEEEDVILKGLYSAMNSGKITMDEVCRAFPKRKRGDVQAHASKLGYASLEKKRSQKGNVDIGYVAKLRDDGKL